VIPQPGHGTPVAALKRQNGRNGEMLSRRGDEAMPRVAQRHVHHAGGGGAAAHQRRDLVGVAGGETPPGQPPTAVTMKSVGTRAARVRR